MSTIRSSGGYSMYRPAIQQKWKALTKFRNLRLKDMNLLDMLIYKTADTSFSVPLAGGGGLGFLFKISTILLHDLEIRKTA